MTDNERIANHNICFYLNFKLVIYSTFYLYEEPCMLPLLLTSEMWNHIERPHKKG